MRREIQIFLFFFLNKKLHKAPFISGYLNQENILCADMEKQHFHHINAEMSGLSYLLQEDASEDGATTQQQGQQADKCHQHIKELPRIALS